MASGNTLHFRPRPLLRVAENTIFAAGESEGITAAGESETEWQQERVRQNAAGESEAEWQQERVRQNGSRRE